MPQALSTPPIVTAGDLGGNAASWARHLRASNLAPRTRQTYIEAVTGFARFLTANGMPVNVPGPSVTAMRSISEKPHPASAIASRTIGAMASA